MLKCSFQKNAYVQSMSSFPTTTVCRVASIMQSVVIHYNMICNMLQAADRFMHMLEYPDGPEHLVVFITSDQDFSEKIQELQRRNFKVAVLHHKLCASAQPVGIINTADEAYDLVAIFGATPRHSWIHKACMQTSQENKGDEHEQSLSSAYCLAWRCYAWAANPCPSAWLTTCFQILTYIEGPAPFMGVGCWHIIALTQLKCSNCEPCCHDQNTLQWMYVNLLTLS